VTLTPDGAATAATVRAAFGALEHRALAGLTAAEVAGFFAVVRALTEPGA
jgi:DNA-binding MarR family transcriptional regulator